MRRRTFVAGLSVIAAFGATRAQGTPAIRIGWKLPPRIELAVNMKTAKALDLAVPQSLLLRADSAP
jgi:hypothetical protein